MALVINDRVKETSTTSGTGTLNLAGASQDFITFVAGVGKLILRITVSQTLEQMNLKLVLVQ
jgi:hypothetical protein